MSTSLRYLIPTAKVNSLNLQQGQWPMETNGQKGAAAEEVEMTKESEARVEVKKVEMKKVEMT